MKTILLLLASLGFICVSESLFAQSTSRGPGKGPATAGTGSKYTYPQPQKSKAAALENFVPESQIPDFPERYLWRLVAKNFNSESTSKSIPVYAFNPSNGKRAIVGEAQAGEAITLEEVRVSAKRNYYKFNWNGAPTNNPYIGTKPEFWIDGMYVEFAGKK